MIRAAGQRSWDSLSAERAQREQQHLWRELQTVAARDSVRLRTAQGWFTSFASNDYLGFAQAPWLQDALRDGIEKHGAGAGASRLVCGDFAAHQELEAALARAKGAEAALTFASGYAVPLGVIPALLGPGDTVILDKLCHASLVDAARLSGATLRVFPHNHLGKLERLLASARGRVLVVTEAVFSMDGDRAPLAEIVELKDRHGAWLLLDEAHAFGVLGPQGRGLAAEHGLEDRIELQMGTLSKAAGLSGGYLAAARPVIDHLVNRARSLIYSTAPPPFLAHAAAIAVEKMQAVEGETARARLRARTLKLQHLLGAPASAFVSPILPHHVGDEQRALDLAARLQKAGFLVPAIRYPTVARGAARLRISLSAAHEDTDLQRLASTLERAAPAPKAAPSSSCQQI